MTTPLEELIPYLRSYHTVRKGGYLSMPMDQLAGTLQRLGRSGRGSREELIERLATEVWKSKYDQYDRSKL